MLQDFNLFLITPNMNIIMFMIQNIEIVNPKMLNSYIEMLYLMQTQIELISFCMSWHEVSHFQDYHQMTMLINQHTFD